MHTHLINLHHPKASGDALMAAELLYLSLFLWRSALFTAADMPKSWNSGVGVTGADRAALIYNSWGSNPGAQAGMFSWSWGEVISECQLFP